MDVVFAFLVGMKVVGVEINVGLLLLLSVVFRSGKFAVVYLFAFVSQDNFVSILNRLGFKDTLCTPLTLGISSLYTGVK